MCGYGLFSVGCFVFLVGVISFLFIPKRGIVIAIIGAVLIFSGKYMCEQIHVPGYKPNAEEREWHDIYHGHFPEEHCPWDADK